jgi:hypothetical protein
MACPIVNFIFVGQIANLPFPFSFAMQPSFVGACHWHALLFNFSPFFKSPRKSAWVRRLPAAITHTDDMTEGVVYFHSPMPSA